MMLSAVMALVENSIQIAMAIRWPLYDTHRLRSVIDQAVVVLILKDIHLRTHTGRHTATARTGRTATTATTAACLLLHHSLTHLLRHLVLLCLAQLRLVHDVLLTRRGCT